MVDETRTGDQVAVTLSGGQLELLCSALGSHESEAVEAEGQWRRTAHDPDRRAEALEHAEACGRIARQSFTLRQELADVRRSLLR